MLLLLSTRLALIVVVQVRQPDDRPEEGVLSQHGEPKHRPANGDAEHGRNKVE